MVEEDKERTKGERNTDKMVHQFRTHTVRTEGPTPSGFIQCVRASACVCVCVHVSVCVCVCAHTNRSLLHENSSHHELVIISNRPKDAVVKHMPGDVLHREEGIFKQQQ